MGVDELRNLSNTLLTQLYSQNSDDPFLTLLELSHESFDTVYFVANTESITSNGQEYTAFPFKLTLPVDDGESLREVKIDFDNVSRELIDEIRTITSPMDAKVKMVLASNPDFVEIELSELKVKDINYNAQTVSARLFVDDFLNTGLTSEKYTPQFYPGIF